MFLLFASLAQTPCFTADHDTVCVGIPVTFTQCPDWNVVRYDFDDGNGYGSIGVNSVIYTEPGVKKVLLNGNNRKNNDSVAGPLSIVVIRPTPPVFTITSCEGKNVSLTLTDKVYKSYTISQDSNPSVPISKGSTMSLSYFTPGLKTIKIRGTSTSGCEDDTTYTFEVFESMISPVITNITSGQNKLSVKLDPASIKAFLKYKVEVSEGGSFVLAGELTKQGNIYNNEFTIENVNGLGPIDPSQKRYCIKVTAIDDCGKQLSNQACSILLNAQSLPDQNNVQWSSSASFGSFVLSENNVQSSYGGGVLNYQNSNIACDKDYCYSVKGTLGSLTVISNTSCVKGKSNKIPPVIHDFVASVQDNNIKLTWGKPANTTIKSFKLQKEDGTGFRTIYSGLDNEFTDTQINASNSPACYQIFYSDSCDNQSPISLPSCSILLKGELINKNNNKLQWNEYKAFESGVRQYYLQYLDEDGEVLEDIPMGMSTSFNDLKENKNQVIRYRIKVESNDADPLVSFSNIVPIKQNFLILLPNAFTPNGDAKNETFHPFGPFIKSYAMQIYNKWGELIFEGPIWDGRGKNGDAPSGTYVCYIEAEDFTGEKFIRKGTVILIR